MRIVQVVTLMMAMATGQAIAVDLKPAERIDPYQPISVPIDSAVIDLNGTPLPEANAIRIGDRLVFAAPPGRYLVVAGDSVAMVVIGSGGSTPVEPAIAILSPEPAPELPDEDPFPDPPTKREAYPREVVLLSRPNCPPCDQWLRDEKSKLEAQGFTVSVNKQLAVEKGISTPSFAIPVNRSDATMWRIFTGYRSANALVAIHATESTKPVE